MGEINYLRDSDTGVTYDLMPKDGGITEAKLSDELQEKLQELELGIGSPLVASTAAEMTDTDKIYVYTGSETGYTSGNWYYYNGSAWTSGGVYNSMALETDKTLQVSGAAADAKVVGDEVTQLKEDLEAEENAREAADDAINATLETKANVNGYYQEMTVGDAEQLVSTVFVEDSVPYQFRTSGGSADIGDREYDEIVGGSIVWNQLGKAFVSGNWQAESGVTATYSDGVATVTSTTASNGIISSFSWLKDHVYFVAYGCMGSAGTIAAISNTSSITINHTIASANTWESAGSVLKANAVKGILYLFGRGSTYENLKFKNLTVFDLTQMFGSTIADYIYSLEQATAGAGVAWFKQFFSEDYYPYDAGTMKHVEGLSAHVMRDANENVIGNYPLDDSLTLRGIPKLDSNNQLYYDGDIYSADGTVTRKYGIVDLGTLTWGNASEGGFAFASLSSVGSGSNDKLNDNFRCDKYTSVYWNSHENKTVRFSGSGTQVGVKDSDYANYTAAQIKTAMSGVMLVYELATPTTETATPFTNPQVCDPYGTEEYVTTSLVPVGHYTKYPANLRSAIERVMEQVPEAPSENGTYVLKATKTSSGVTYAWTAE